MKTSESLYSSFVVKIWIEETAGRAGHGTWRGHITHVVSGERCYFENLNGITDFIAHYIDEMGVRPGTESTLGRWLKFLNRASDPR